NPLFVTELVRLVGAAPSARLPDTIGDLVRRRLERCRPVLRQRLRHASVLGRDFDATVLAELTATGPADLLGLLDEAAAAGLVDVGGGRARFAHVLTQEVLYAELPAARRRRLHARAAQLLRDPADLDALAYHLRQAVPLNPIDEALRATVAAAARARDQLAYEHAAALLRDALALDPADPRTRADLQLELAACELRSGAVDRAWRACRAAAGIGRVLADPAIIADAATLPRGVTDSAVTRQIHAACRQALALIPADDLVRTARLLAQLAVTADRFDPDVEPDLGTRALAAARHCADSQALALALHARHEELIDLAHVRDRQDIGAQAVRLGRGTHDEETTCWGYTWRINAAAQL